MMEQCKCGFPTSLTTELFSWTEDYMAFHIWMMDGVEYGYTCKQGDK